MVEPTAASAAISSLGSAQMQQTDGDAHAALEWKMKNDELFHQFHKRLDTSVVPRFHDRESRNRWAASFLDGLPGTGILNLGGGGKRHLGKHVGARWQVHEVDITGDCDTLANLDTVERLPFDDASFDICCAFEVLEHLERFHFIADEMYRVARSDILIALPNAAVEIVPILRNLRGFDDPGQNGVYSKFYGLPLQVPEDRHRWWLTFEDIVRYFLWFESVKGCNLTFFVPDYEFSMKRKLFRALCGERLFLNLFCTSVWMRIQKK